MAVHTPIILPYGKYSPQIHESAWIAPGAVVTGDTIIEEHCTLLFNCVIRGDVNTVRIGAGSNIQDLVMLHVADNYPCIIGRGVTVGHSAILHGCTVEDGCLIGMGARVLNGAVIGRGSIIAAGAVVGEGAVIPPLSIAAGIPAQVKGEVTLRTLEKIGALEKIANGEDIEPELRGLAGTPFARKYRRIARAYLEGKTYRPGRDEDDLD
jgi:carbonic anhydrase/acetyltransferase-like protein (isoleucine patch superfamily)